MIKKIYNLTKKIKKIHFLVSFFVVVVFVAFFTLMPKTHATYGDKIYGFAWSNNIGWISFNNCTDPDIAASCTGQSYGVSYNPVNLNLNGFAPLNGYAWSNNIGWIKFGGLSGFPSSTGNGTVAEDAKIVTSGTNTWKLTGWARVVSPSAADDGACPASDPDNDGCWDGWISLSGTGYGINFAVNGLSTAPSYAWGSSVVGWIDFAQTKIKPPVTFTGAAILSFSGPTCVLNSGTNANQVQLSWTTVGMTSCAIYKNNINTYSVPTTDLNSGSSPALGSVVPPALTVSPPSSTFILRCCVDGPGLCSSSLGTTYSSDTKNISTQASCVPITINKKPAIIER